MQGEANIQLICGRMEDLINQMESAKSVIITEYAKFNPSASMDYLDYNIQCTIFEGTLHFTYTDIDNDCIVALGVWDANILYIKAVPPVQYDDYLASFEGV